VNDCEISFIKDKFPYIELELLNISLLMYSDDMVLLAETLEGLQERLDSQM